MTRQPYNRTPCIGVCDSLSNDSVCSGCFRTNQEIYDWGKMSVGEQDTVLRLIKLRKAKDARGG